MGENELPLALSMVAASLIAGFLAGYLASLRRVRRVERALEALHRAAISEKALRKAVRLASKKPKRRYIVFEVLSAEPVDESLIERSVIDLFRALYGEIALSDSRLKLVDYDSSINRGIFSIRREYKHHALAVLGLIRRINGREVMLMPIAVSGTLKRARKRLER